MADCQVESDKRIRRLRKKLRQIEVLEYSNRILNHEELQKVNKKDTLRIELSDLLKALQSAEEIDCPEVEDGFTILKAEDLNSVVSDEMKRRASETQTEHLPEKRKPPAPESQEQIDEQPSISESVPGSSGDQTQNSGSSQVADSEKDSEDKKSKNRIRKLRTSLEKSHWSVQELEGHEDLILDCDILDDLAVTASRDTTLKVESNLLYFRPKDDISGVEHLHRRLGSEHARSLRGRDWRPVPRQGHRRQAGQRRHGGGGQAGVRRL